MLKNKKDIEWFIIDIIGILPRICTYKIYLELNCIPSIKCQHSLNLPMQEVIKKEVIKWLDTGVIYPNIDIKWLILVCVIRRAESLCFLM